MPTHLPSISKISFLSSSQYKSIDMNFKELLENMKATMLPALVEEGTKAFFLEQYELLRKAFAKEEFKLKRTIQDKQITTNVLENTISKLRIKSKNLEHQKALTEEQARFKEQLFANVSHELRTPLHGILGMGHLLENTNLDKIQRGYVDIIKSSADNLLVIINDLLSLSKINAGKVSLLNEPFSTQKFFTDLKGILELKAQHKDLELLFSIPSDLPSYLLGDRTRLSQVLLNLLNNAIKFTHKGYVALKIYILRRSGQSIELQFDIEDTGIGIEKDKLDSIFDSFIQVHQQSADVYEGVGLGLNIVKKLLDLMDGKIKVHSEKGKGTVFSIKLSFDYPSEKMVQVYQNAQTNLVIPPHWQYKRLLLIEDNEANLLYVKNIFLDWKIPLDIAKSKAEAAEKLTKNTYDCLLSDVKLPDGNGLDLIAKIRSEGHHPNRHTPVIVLTASANEKEAIFSKEINVQSYVGKPFPPELLVSELKKVLDQPFVVKSPITTLTNTTGKVKKHNTYFSQLEKSFEGKPKLKLEMIDIFLEQIGPAISEMKQSLEVNDIERFYFHAHRIKSTINIIGLKKLQPLVADMDEFCYKKINLEQLPKLLEKFQKQAILDIQQISKEKENLLAMV